jgi:hypothetical protein
MLGRCRSIEESRWISLLARGVRPLHLLALFCHLLQAKSSAPPINNLYSALGQVPASDAPSSMPISLIRRAIMRFATTLLPCLSVPPQAGRLSVPFTCAYSARESNERSTKYSISSDSRKCKHTFYSTSSSRKPDFSQFARAHWRSLSGWFTRGSTSVLITKSAALGHGKRGRRPWRIPHGTRLVTPYEPLPDLRASLSPVQEAPAIIPAPVPPERPSCQ